MYKRQDKNYLMELIKTLGLEKRVNHLPNELSGGQQQRVSIGRALIYHPSLVLADEPTGNLDSKSSHEIMELLEISNKKDVYKRQPIYKTVNLNYDKIFENKDVRTVDYNKILELSLIHICGAEESRTPVQTILYINVYRFSWNSFNIRIGSNPPNSYTSFINIRKVI